MLRQVRKFSELSWQLKWLLLRAYFLLGYQRLVISTRPLKKQLNRLQMCREAIVPAELSEEDRIEAASIGWAIRTAANFTPWDSSCLVQVLAAQRMLRGRGIPGAIYVGATSGSLNGKDRALAAHAWLKCGTEFITGESGHAEYAVVTCFSW